jgi:hypothetical protein
MGRGAHGVAESSQARRRGATRGLPVDDRDRRPGARRPLSAGFRTSRPRPSQATLDGRGAQSVVVVLSGGRGEGDAPPGRSSRSSNALAGLGVPVGQSLLTATLRLLAPTGPTAPSQSTISSVMGRNAGARSRRPIDLEDRQTYGVKDGSNRSAGPVSGGRGGSRSKRRRASARPAASVSSRSWPRGTGPGGSDRASGRCESSPTRSSWSTTGRRRPPPSVEAGATVFGPASRGRGRTLEGAAAAQATDLVAGGRRPRRDRLEALPLLEAVDAASGSRDPSCPPRARVGSGSSSGSPPT